MTQLGLNLLDEANAKKVEVRLIHLSEVFMYEQNPAQRAELQEEYRRLHAHWLAIRDAA